MGRKGPLSNNYTIGEENHMKPLERMALALYKNPKSIPGYLNNGKNQITINHLIKMIEKDRNGIYSTKGEKEQILNLIEANSCSTSLPKPERVSV